jgi:hypothetical protein
MDPEIRKVRRNVMLGAILVPVILLLWLGASCFMPSDLWMSWSFLVGFVAVICEISRTSPDDVRNVRFFRGSGWSNWTSRTFGVLLILSGHFMGRSERVKAFLADVSDNGVDLPLLGGLGLLLLGITVFRLGNARGVADDELRSFVDRKAHAEAEKRRRAAVPVEY